VWVGGVGGWGVGFVPPTPNPQTPIPNPQSPILINQNKKNIFIKLINIKIYYIK